MSTEAPDLNPEDETQVEKTLSKEFYRDGEMFRGTRLWPYKPGSRDIYHSACSPDDPILYRALAFVYIHIRRAATMEEDFAANIIPLVFEDLNRFRARIYLEFRSTLTEEDIRQVYSIAEKELGLVRLSEIIAAPPELGSGAGKKKAGPTIRRKSAQKSTRRQKK